MTQVSYEVSDFVTQACTARRCSEQGCNQPVVVVSVGTEAVRAPTGFAVTRGVPDRNYCLRHAPGLVGEKVA